MFWLLLVSSTVAGPLEAGQYEQSIRAMRQLLSKQDQPPIWARLGSALARAGRYQEALDAFELGKGAYHEVSALADHADALRGVGRCEEALALRNSARLTAPTEAREIALYVGLVDDAKACGDLERALSFGFDALAVYPESAAVHAALSDIYRSTGEIDDADWHLMLASALDPGDPRTRVARLRAYASEQRWPELSALLEQMKGPEARLPAFFIARMQLVFAQGRMRDAATLCQDELWILHEDKDVQALRTLVSERLGLGRLPVPGPSNIRRPMVGGAPGARQGAVRLGTQK